MFAEATTCNTLCTGAFIIIGFWGFIALMAWRKITSIPGGGNAAKGIAGALIGTLLKR